MQQPLRDRMTSLESATERHEQRIQRLDAIIENHDQLFERLVTSQEELQAGQARLEARHDRLEANQEAMVTLLQELTSQVTATHRIWLRLAERFGWTDDEQNGAGPSPPG